MKIWKYRGTWVLEMSRHTPTALGTSGALGLGWDTPRSIKIGHVHVGIILRPPGRCFMRQCVFTWAKFRLTSTESLKNKTRVVGEGKGMVLAWGWGAHGVFFPTRDPHSPSCGHFHTLSQKKQISRNAGMRDKRDEGWATQGGGGGGRTKQGGKCARGHKTTKDRHTHTPGP
jgi:hypothetical protein